MTVPATLISTLFRNTAIAISYTTATLTRTLSNPNPYGTSQDAYATTLAMSGNYAIIGAPSETDASGAVTTGKAYIYNVTTGAKLFTLDNPNAYGTSTGDQFGSYTAIGGTYAAVAAAGEADASAPTSGSASGKVYIFNVTTGALVRTLDNPNPYGTSASDQFGSLGIAISGNYIVVGAQAEDDATMLNNGKAYIFNITTGALLFTLNDPNAYNNGTGDYFGVGIAASGDYVIIGARGEGDTGGAGAGKAYIFNITTGALVHTLNDPNAYGTSASDTFGLRVAMDGNYAIVGVQQEGDATGTLSGKAYIYNVTTGALVRIIDNPNPVQWTGMSGDQFGRAVAISGNYAIIGAPYEDTSSTEVDSGKAYMFDITTGALIRTFNDPNPVGTSASDNFGMPVAISGNSVLIGATGESDGVNSYAGKAYIYQLS